MGIFGTRTPFTFLERIPPSTHPSRIHWILSLTQCAKQVDPEWSMRRIQSFITCIEFTAFSMNHMRFREFSGHCLNLIECGSRLNRGCLSLRRNPLHPGLERHFLLLNLGTMDGCYLEVGRNNNESSGLVARSLGESNSRPRALVPQRSRMENALLNLQ